MMDFLGTPAAKAVLVTAVLAILVLIGYYLVRRFRDFRDEDVPSTNEMLTNFRELRHKGDINEEEFRDIRTVLGKKLQQELKDDGQED